MKGATPPEPGANSSDSGGFWDQVARDGSSARGAFLCSKIFWPELVEVGGHVFIKEQFDLDAYSSALALVGPTKIEEYFNTVYLDSLFTSGPADPQLFEALGRTLAELWELRASIEFPGKNFVAEFAWFSDEGDPAVTLY